MGVLERRGYLTSASENLEAVKQGLENLILEVENVLQDWRQNQSLLPEDSDDMDEHQEKVDHYEETLSSLEEAKDIIDGVVLEP